MNPSLRLKSSLLSLLLLMVLLAVWQIATQPRQAVPAPAVALTAEQIEYQKMLGKDPAASSGSAEAGKGAGFPTPMQMGQTIYKHLSDPI
jgi:nitrate/nitrite transport system permease protein